MFYADVFVFKIPCDLFRVHENAAQPCRAVNGIISSLYFRELRNFIRHFRLKSRAVYSHIFQQLGNQAVFLLQQRQMEMLSIHLLISFTNSYILTIQNGALCLLCIFLKVHSPNSFPDPFHSAFFYLRCLRMIYTTFSLL